MTRTLTLCAYLLVLSAHAQLINGSFEDDGSPSLYAWEWTCGDPGQPNEGAPSSGDWSATKQPGHAKGCFPSYLFQRLPWATNGQLLTVTGWVRCDDLPICLGAYLGLGTVNSGAFTLEENVGTMNSIWEFVSITDTVQLAAGDTALVILNSGFIGGPANPYPGHFDGISVAAATGMHDQEAPLVHAYWDGRTGLFAVACEDRSITGLQLLDATGRELPVRLAQYDRSQVTIDMNGAISGIYLVKLITDRGDRVVRFVKH